MRLGDMPTFCHPTDIGEWLVHFHVHQNRTCAAARAVVLNRFRDMEKDVVDALIAQAAPAAHLHSHPSARSPAPSRRCCRRPAASGGTVILLLQDDGVCMAWLNGKAAGSVVYLSFGSHTSMGAGTKTMVA